MWEVDTNGVYISVSDKVEDILGYKAEEMIGKTPFDFMPESEAKNLAKSFQNLVSRELDILDFENVNIHKNGTNVFLITNGVPIYKDKKLVGYRGTDKDISEKRQSDEKYKTLLSLASDGIHVLDLNGNVKQCSESFANTLGYTKEEVLQLNIIDIDCNFDPSITVELINEIIQKPRLFETKHRKKDGSILNVQINAKGIEINGEWFLYASQRDITELKQKDHLILEQSKMVAVGEMIANISHQWRQPLNVISTGVTGMAIQKKMGMLNNDNFEETCKLINHNTQYLSTTIDTFRNFIRNDKILKEHPIEDEIFQAVSIVNTALKDKYILIKDNVDYQQKTILSIPENELSQVIINIINNSKDALLENNIENAWVEINFIKEANKLVISIEDNAKGIPTEVLPRIFEPYFTTKHKSLGTGLGLHISYQIVTDSLHGTISATNTSNGAKLTIEIPTFK